MRTARHFMERRGQITAALLLIPLAAAPSSLAQDCDPAQVQKLLPSRGAAFDYFGETSALTEQSGAIGISRDAVYMFGWNGFQFVEQARLIPPDGGFLDGFGCSIAFADDAVVIGARDHDEFGFRGCLYLQARSRRPVAARR